MLYSILKLIIGTGLRLHFQRIETNGLEKLEQPGPAIIIANHTNALTDPLLLGILLKRRIHFYVRGDVFEHPLARRLFNNLGMMPIFRLKDGREKLNNNEASNEQALRILAAGGAILIFGEGSSDEKKWMRPMKKGPFRLAAEAAQSLPKPPALLPLGINYLEPEMPGTTAWLIAGDEIQWPEKWQDLPEAKLSLELMKATDKSFQELTLHAGDEKKAEIAEILLLLKKTGHGQKTIQTGHFNFQVAQSILRRLSDMPEDSFFELREKAREYDKLLQEFGLASSSFKKASMRELWATALLGFPIWLTGLAFHWVPFFVGRLIVRKTVSSKDFISSIHVLSVTFLNLIWYVLWLLVLSLAWSFTGAVLLLLALAACGVITYTILLPAVVQLKIQLRLRTMQQKRKEPIKRLLSLRRDLLAWLSESD